MASKEINPEKEAILNQLKEEYNTILQKKSILRDNDKIIKDIYINIKNKVEIDPFMTDKLKLKKPKPKASNSGGCCILF